MPESLHYAPMKQGQRIRVVLWVIEIGTIALLTNVYCLTLIAKRRRGEVHIQTSLGK